MTILGIGCTTSNFPSSVFRNLIAGSLSSLSLLSKKQCFSQYFCVLRLLFPKMGVSVQQLIMFGIEGSEAIYSLGAAHLGLWIFSFPSIVT